MRLQAALHQIQPHHPITNTFSVAVILIRAVVFVTFFLAVGPDDVLEQSDGLGGAAGGVTAGFVVREASHRRQPSASFLGR